MNCIDTVLATSRPCEPFRYHHRMPTNTKASENQSKLQPTASLVVTLCAPGAP